MTSCGHLLTTRYPLLVDLVLDDQLGFTDALVHCDVCQQPYLLEMLDWTGTERLFRMSMPSRGHCQKLIRNLTRGSCDIRRAGDEIRHLQSRQPFLDQLLWLDTHQPAVLALPSVAGESLPGASWRELPCDGSWFDQLRTNTEIVKG